jgi:sodium/proline symporter
MLEITTLIVYFCFLLAVAFFSYQKQRSDTEYVLGSRSMNFWLTALSAHASDMSSWLFLGYPAMIFTNGLMGAWAAIGLTLFMFLNWHFIAPRIRIATERFNSLTINAYFESRFDDRSGSIRVVSAAMSVLFFTIYISSGLVALGVIVETLFNMPYTVGISLGLLIVVIYVFMGGYRTIAWIDVFQGFFLLAVIVFIPAVLLMQIGSIHPVLNAAAAHKLSTSLIPDLSAHTLLTIFLTAAGWGLGYFGQPQIITKFMGIRHVSEMYKAKWLGISWQFTALAAATLVGLIGIYLFPSGLDDPQRVILNIVQETLPAFFAILVLCAILAATTNVMAAQILVVASNLSEDFYKRILRQDATHLELLWASRISVLIIALIGFIIAYFNISTIYGLVLYAWSGLGASFGPLILLSLYRKSINRYGAFVGILVGGLTAAIWPYFEHLYHWENSSLVAGFILSILSMESVSFLTRRRASTKNGAL